MYWWRCELVSNSSTAKYNSTANMYIFFRSFAIACSLRSAPCPHTLMLSPTTWFSKSLRRLLLPNARLGNFTKLMRSSRKESVLTE